MPMPSANARSQPEAPAHPHHLHGMPGLTLGSRCMPALVERLRQPQPEPPTSLNVTVRSPRPRDYLTEREVERLMDAARENRWGHRDATAILLAYRHGLRASELVALRWDDINLQPAGRKAARAPLLGRGNKRPPARRSGATCLAPLAA